MDGVVCFMKSERNIREENGERENIRTLSVESRKIISDVLDHGKNSSLKENDSSANNDFNAVLVEHVVEALRRKRGK